ncbi:DNA polymerase IV [Corallococcus exiguus]|uniref:DNA polymerase IV n=1 Tax=Corallococcus TaxID=83461 RepID=UPI000EA205DE|nr:MULTISPECIES: DNA polymerase IV [Corallococcus]NNC21730.1 DNA polymerase IV [Corallococcus exiguus]RKH15264.1 DNA polymerase IV [Corallococcus sp. CA041A]RKH96362.1 DNA polymerase IV [Corallococcus sp. AB030]RUO89300.1 DNA polymerase IV [Corallococcus sp. AB018]
MRAILHVDMDAFYASVEQRDNPSLRGKPVIVGGHAQRGVVVAASYEVRPFGVRSAMPMARAMKQAPHAIVVKPRFSAYAEASEHVFAIFERYTPLIEPLSLDEAFLDVTASVGLFGAAADIAKRIRKEISHELNLPASAGIATAKFVAKIASDLAKPNGQREVRPEETVAFLAGLPVSRLWGVGPKTEEAMKRAGLVTIGDVAARDVDWLEERFGAASAKHLWELSHGIDARDVVPDRAAKSVGAEDTFDEDLTGLEALKPHVHAQALRVARRLRRATLKGRVVQLKLKFADFTLITRRVTLREATDDGQVIYRAALELLERAHEGKALRLTGVSVQLDEDEPQLGLFPAAAPKSSKLNEAMDRIAARFGSKAITMADIAEAEASDDDQHRSEKPVDKPKR